MRLARAREDPDTIAVTVGQPVLRGQRIGTIGTARGQYLAHLHFELRGAVGLPLGGGRGVVAGQISPRDFIAQPRPRR